MDIAFCTLDEKVWNSEDFWSLGEKNIVTLRRNLKCVSCEGDAWFRKSSYGNKVPHFCAHHLDDCNYATNYEVIDDGDGGDGQPAANPNSGITLNLGLENNYDVDVGTKPPPDNIPHGEKRSGNKAKNAGGKDYPAHLSLKNLLYKLVRSPDENYAHGTNVFIPDAPFPDLPSSADELFVHFKNVHEDLHEKNRIFWGFISDAAYSNDGKLWLNAGSRSDGLSVAIRPEITEEFLQYFKVGNDLEQLQGCHALIIGDCYYATTGKPVIWCSKLDFIVLRRYNFDTH